MPKSVIEKVKDEFPGEVNTPDDAAKKIAQVLVEHEGNIPAAALDLGLSRSGLWRYINNQ